MDIPDHTTTADAAADTWSCACGVTGGPDLSEEPVDVYTRAEAHQEHVERRLLPLLTSAQLTQALRGAAGDDPQKQAAVELLIRHGYWLGNGHLRAYMTAEWAGGVCLVRITWPEVMAGLDQHGRAIAALRETHPEDTLSDGLRNRLNQLTGGLADWVKDRETEMWDDASFYDGCPLLKASTAEVAVLRMAASIASGGLFYLNRDTYNFGTVLRGMALTAFGHLLTHGGTLPVRLAASWRVWAAVADPDQDPVDVIDDLFPIDGPHSADQTVAAAACVARLVRYLNHATLPNRTDSSAPYPATVYNVIGSVRAAVSLLDQTLRQCGDRLTELADRPDAYQTDSSDERWPAAGTPPATALRANTDLGAARSDLTHAWQALNDAHVYAGRLGLATVPEGDTDD